MKASFQRADLSSLPTSSADLFRSCAVLFPDAEILEDVSQDFVGGDFTDDGADVVDGFADVLCGEVGWEAEGESFLDAEEGSAGIGEGLHVALVCDQSCVAVCE